jgi:3-oxoadipate enol-lactonase
MSTSSVTQSGRLPIVGADLYYEITGTGPAVVLVHGFSLDGRMWDDQVVALREVSTVVRYDLRGFGRSSLPTPGVAYSHSVDLLALLDHLGICSAVLVGLSMGGLVAMHAALVAPERVRGLVLLDSVLDGVVWDRASAQAMTAAGRAAVMQGVEAAKELWLRHPLFVPARRDPRLAARLAALVDPYSWFHYLQEDPAEPLRPSPNQELEAIAAPTTVVVGELDVPCFLTMADVLARRIPGARKVDVPNAGHMVNLEAADVVNALLREAVATAQ